MMIRVSPPGTTHTRRYPRRGLATHAVDHPTLTDPLMVGIRSPDGLVVGLAPATLEFWVRFPNEMNQGKQGARESVLFIST
jgi:hypothetical protein